MKHDIALKVAEAFAEQLRPACERIEIAGSVKRLKPEVKDIEILAVPDLTPLPRPVPVFGEREPKFYKLRIDQVLGQMVTEGAIEFKMNGERMKKIYLHYAGIFVDLFLVRPPSEWGVQAVIRTGPAEFGEWCVTNRAAGGGLPDGYFVKHGAVWVASVIKKADVPDDPNKAIEFLRGANHLSMLNEADFLDFVGVGWVEPKDRKAKWRR